MSCHVMSCCILFYFSYFFHRFIFRIFYYYLLYFYCHVFLFSYFFYYSSYFYFVVFCFSCLLSIGLKAHFFWLKILAQIDPRRGPWQQTNSPGRNRPSNSRPRPASPPFSHVGRAPRLFLLLLARASLASLVLFFFSFTRPAPGHQWLWPFFPSRMKAFLSFSSLACYLLAGARCHHGFFLLPTKQLLRERKPKHLLFPPFCSHMKESFAFPSKAVG